MGVFKKMNITEEKRYIEKYLLFCTQQLVVLCQMSQQKKQQLKERIQRNNEHIKKSIKNEYVYVLFG